MKYIRTKNGIFEVIELHTTTNEKGSFISDYFCKGFRTVLAENVIDIADTIEELIDEFVVPDIHKAKRLHFIDFKSIVAYCEENGLDKTTIKGAIWTEWGLKYVAKINDKGELELI